MTRQTEYVDSWIHLENDGKRADAPRSEFHQGYLKAPVSGGKSDVVTQQQFG